MNTLSLIMTAIAVHTVLMPSSTLIWIIAGISVLFLISYFVVEQQKIGLFSNFGGEPDVDGMKKMWMYKSAPYTKMFTIFLTIAAAFLSAVLLLLLCGGVVWALFWLINIVFWAIIIIGWIMLVVGFLGFIGRQGWGCGCLLVGVVIVCCQTTLKEWGEMFVSWGTTVLSTLNVVDWTVSLFASYGFAMLAIAIAPLACFLALALLLITVSYVLRFVEFVAMKCYRVHRPCPFCGSKDGFTYMIDGSEYTTPLHPGVYGILHQTNSETGTSVPTMLMNGKALLTRRCDSCGSIINKSHDFVVGTDIHIGIVGERSSGKSYMLYAGLERLQQRFGDELEQVDADRSTRIATIAQRIHRGEGIQTMVKNRYKALQLTLKRKMRLVPFHLFFYDVAGEMFNVKAVKKQSVLDFYNNVKTIAFIIDPSMVDISHVAPMDGFVEWHQQHATHEQYNPESTLGMLKKILEEHGRKAQDIALHIVFSKKDMGYFESIHLSSSPTGEEIKAFLNQGLGLYSLGNFIDASFKTVDYHTISVDDAESLDVLFLRLLAENGVSID